MRKQVKHTKSGLTLKKAYLKKLEMRLADNNKRIVALKAKIREYELKQETLRAHKAVVQHEIASLSS
jgi:septal ring factor EnvC (AmiA/AmiB activator)